MLTTDTCKICVAALVSTYALFFKVLVETKSMTRDDIKLRRKSGKSRTYKDFFTSHTKLKGPETQIYTHIYQVHT